jgi:hypothetical protein
MFILNIGRIAISGLQASKKVKTDEKTAQYFMDLLGDLPEKCDAAII